MNSKSFIWKRSVINHTLCINRSFITRYIFTCSLPLPLYWLFYFFRHPFLFFILEILLMLCQQRQRKNWIIGNIPGSLQSFVDEVLPPYLWQHRPSDAAWRSSLPSHSLLRLQMLALTLKKVGVSLGSRSMQSS